MGVLPCAQVADVFKLVGRHMTVGVFVEEAIVAFQQLGPAFVLARIAERTLGFLQAELSVAVRVRAAEQRLVYARTNPLRDLAAHVRAAQRLSVGQIRNMVLALPQQHLV